jgi:hypothetical protein
MFSAFEKWLVPLPKIALMVAHGYYQLSQLFQYLPLSFSTLQVFLFDLPSASKERWLF